MSTILLIEDDPVLARGLQIVLELEGYTVSHAANLKDAFKIDKTNILLAIVDINLPDGTGFDFVKKMQETHDSVPIIILTARTDEDDAVYGLQIGAHDYIRKPFGNRELIARINVLLKATRQVMRQYRLGDLAMLPDERRVEYQGKNLDLNRREFDILQHFIQKAGNIVTREYLLTHIDSECKLSDRTIDSHISHLRSRLKKSGITHIKISSIYGIGYRLDRI